MSSRDVAVVIPTRDRRTSLERTLRALGRAQFAPNRFEAVVSIDGPDQGTEAFVRALGLPYRISVVWSDEARGAASARNRGAAAADAEFLVFLDDDIEAGPDLIGSHVAAQREGVRVTIGYLPPAFDDTVRGFFRGALRGWWEAMFEAMRRPGHRYWFRDLLTGNCAISASLFERLGGYDPAFSCHEDYEFGVRVIELGSPMAFVEAARGTHHERTTLSRAFARRRDEGRADVLMLEKHPEVQPSLPLGVFERNASRVQRLLRRLTFERPAAARLLAAALTRTLAPLEYGRLRGRWTRRLHDVLSYWYWQGVSARLPTFHGYTAFIEECRARSTWSPLTLEVDLANGLELIMAQIDRRRPAGLRVTLKGVTVGEIPAVPGAEGLMGRHLKAALANQLAFPALSALGEIGSLGVRSGDHGLDATGPLPADSTRL